MAESAPRLLTMTGAVLLVLYPEKKGLLTPDLAERIRLKSKDGLKLAPNLNQLHATVGELEKSKRLVKERSTEKTIARHNPPTRVSLTDLGRKEAAALISFFHLSTKK